MTTLHITCTGCGAHIGDWQQHLRWHRHVDPDAALDDGGCVHGIADGWTCHQCWPDDTRTPRRPGAVDT